MSKYDFVLLAAQSEDFIARLRELGLVDITTTGWEPSEEDRQLLLDIEGGTKAIEFLRAWRAEHADRTDGTGSEDRRGAGQAAASVAVSAASADRTGAGQAASAAPAASGAEVYELYTEAQRRAAALRGEIARLEKVAEELRPWGGFDPERAAKLAEQGIVLRYFFTQSHTFDKMQAEWAERYTLSVIDRTEATVRFVVVAAPGAEVTLDAQEMKAPTMDYREAERLIEVHGRELEALDREDFARAAASLELLEKHVAALRERLQTVRVEATAQPAADGSLVLLEGWAETATSARVDALLEAYPGVVYLKSDPTPEDDTPVKLNNGWFARIFELVGDMYARPRYGTIDLTPFFAPFYMFFFAICLNDAGYGAILTLMGLWLLGRNRRPGMMRQAAWFATLCGLATVVVGLFCGSFFGMNLKEYFPEVPFFDFQGRFFSWALAIGVVQILFGMAINVWVLTRSFGFRYALGALGWLLVLLAGALAAGLPMLDPAWAIPGFGTSSPAFYGVVGLGAFLMLFLNTPGRNPILNLGSGLWTLYNNITALLSDVLSYIRLFAIGLSGGVLALVFNSLADGFVPDGAGLGTRILVMLPILVIGHGINLFMSTISSFVHPMRLTFVEFYKNAGFEMASRSFDPLRKIDHEQ